jgi:putative ABC transport system permease protein
LLLVLVLQPAFNQLLDRPLSLASFLAQGLGGRLSVMGLALILVAGVLLSGFYPAFVLSAYQPVTVLKGKLGTSRQGVALRKGLVVGQFAATIVLIIGSLMVYRQIRYMSEKELGLNMDQILVVQAPRLTADDSTFSGRVESFKDALKGVAGVKAATTTRNLPGDELGRAFNVHRKDAAGDPRFTARLLSVNYDFTDVYEIKMLAGRKFSSSDHAHDWDKLHNLVINAKAVQLLGFASPQAAIGKSILVFDNKPMNIVGVMADYHQKSLHSPIEPILLFPSYGTGDPISVKVTTRNLPRTLASIRQQYGAFFPGNVFDYFFLDEKFNQQYKDDQLFGRVFGLFAGFAIFVACLGLFGLSLFTVTQRAKEMGIRKVLGASVPQLVGLLSRDFLQLVLIAFLIATPVAWYMMHQWLKDFAYRVAIEWWIFVLAGVLATSIALITVSFQSIKAALMNPIKSLRSE